MTIPRMVQKSSSGEDVCPLREFVLSHTRVARLRVFLRHGFHFDAAILTIYLVLEIANLRAHINSGKDIENVNIAVDEILLVQMDQAANDLLADDCFPIVSQTDRPFYHMKQVSLFTGFKQYKSVLSESTASHQVLVSADTSISISFFAKTDQAIQVLLD